MVLQAFFNPYLTQQIPHTAKGSAVPYHYGSFRPTTQVLLLSKMAVVYIGAPHWHMQTIGQVPCLLQ